jgi:hypothetical protein
MEKWMSKFPLLFLLLAICSTLFFNAPHFNELPTHRHAWSQFDHHAISIGFIDNGMDFFHPQTNTKILYPWDDVATKKYFSYITSVDFPIHHYIPAISMKIWGNTDPIHNRLYTYIYSLIGIFFLYKLSKLLIESEYLAIIPPLILIFSPIFSYYQVGILPSIPSLSNFIIGTYFYVKYTKSYERKHWIISLLFITLSVLARTSFLFLFLSILFFEFIRVIRTKRNVAYYFLTAISAIAILGIYYGYNYYLRTNYGTLFLNSLASPADFNQFIEVLNKTLSLWKFDYFTKLQFILMAVIAVFVVILNRNFIKRTHLALAGLFMLSAFAFFFLMELQFADHNYYFLDTFMFPILFLIIVLLASIQSHRWLNKVAVLIVLVIFVNGVDKVNRSIKIAYERVVWDVNLPTLEAFKDSKRLLDKNGVPSSATILCYNAYIPSLPFYFMERKGIPIILDEELFIRDSPNWGYDYMVFQNQFFNDRTISVYPKLMNHFEIIDTDGKITLCKKKRTSK